MSHVDEGALHAYLDGALDEFPAADAAEIRTHLDSCADCVARLEHERAIRAEAHAVLSLATPDIEMPTLEDLRAYVKRTRPSKPSASSRMARMGWAASIVFAVGAGWMLRDGQLQSQRLGSQPAVSDARAFEARAPGASATDERQEADTPGTDLVEEVVREQTAPMGVTASPPATPVAAPPEAFADAAVVRRRSNLADADADAVAGRGVAVSDASSSDAMASATVDDAAPADLLGNRVVAVERADVLMTVPSAPAATMAERRSEEVVPEVGILATAVIPLEEEAAARVRRAEEASEQAEPRRTESLRPVTSAIDRGRLSRTMAAVDEDRRIDEEPALAVPGYDVVSVTNLGEGTIAIGAHVLQRFDGPTTFEIFHLEPGVDPVVVPPIPDGDREVRVESEAGWVVVRGPLDDETLGVLLTLLFPG